MLDDNKTVSSKMIQRHSQQYRSESLALAEKVGVPAAAKQLGLHENQLYSWRCKARLLKAEFEWLLATVAVTIESDTQTW